MAKGYVILTEEIHDPAGMAAYKEASGPATMAHGATILAVDTNVQLLEGEWHGTQTVIVEFESVERAREWYESPEYQTAVALRQSASTCNVAIVAGR